MDDPVVKRVLIALAVLVGLGIAYTLLGPAAILFCAAFIGGRCV
jgi:hypothetical protein